MKFLSRIAILLISLHLAACGGGGAGSAGTSNTPINNGGGNTNRKVLFVGDYGNHAFAAFNTLTPAAGTNIAANVLGTNGDALWWGIALDSSRDRLYASTGNAIAVYEHASALSGSITPTRLITPVIKTGFMTLYGMVLDKAHDRLYLGYTVGLGYAIAVFDNISSLNGTVTPSRTIENMYGSIYAIDTQRNILYVANAFTSDLYVYPNLDRVNGFLPKVTPIKSPLLTGKPVISLAMDEQHDRLYMGVAGAGVAIVDSASTGAYATNVIALPNTNAASHSGMAYDPANDRLYAGLDNNVYVFSNASALKPGSASTAVMISAPAGSIINTFAF